MGNINLSTDVAVSTLPDGNLVLYSPSGTAKPFVLTGKAQTIYDKLREQGASFDDLATLLPDQEEVTQILNFLIKERVISGWRTTETNTPTKTQPEPKQVGFWVHTTDRCNLACKYPCYVQKGLSSIGPKVIEAFSCQLRECCQEAQVKKVEVKFAGGEPLLAIPAIRKFVSMLRKSLEPLGISVGFGVITNGTLATTEIANFLKTNKFWVSVSLDGVGGFNAARVHPDGSPSFEETLRGISTLLESGIKPMVLAVISNENLEGVPSLIEFAESLGLALSFSLSRGLSDSGKLNLDAAKFKKTLVPQLEEIVLRTPKLPNISFNNLNLEGKRSRCCVSGTGYIALDSCGNVSSCQMTIGNSLANILTDARGLETALASYHPRKRPTLCNECVWRFACAGGCEVMAKQASREGLPSLHCGANKEILPLLLVLKGRAILELRKEVV